MIVADTGAIVALIDADDQHHLAIRSAYEDSGREWVLPWAILPEVAHILLRHVGARAEAAFMRDLAQGSWVIEWGEPADFVRAEQVAARHAALQLGLVDAVVIAVAERVDARAIVTLDLRDFAAVKVRGAPALWPRDRREAVSLVREGEP